MAQLPCLWREAPGETAHRSSPSAEMPPERPRVFAERLSIATARTHARARAIFARRCKWLIGTPAGHSAILHDEILHGPMPRAAPFSHPLAMASVGSRFHHQGLPRPGLKPARAAATRCLAPISMSPGNRVGAEDDTYGENPYLCHAWRNRSQGVQARADLLRATLYRASNTSRSCQNRGWHEYAQQLFKRILREVSSALKRR